VFASGGLTFAGKRTGAATSAPDSKVRPELISAYRSAGAESGRKDVDTLGRRPSHRSHDSPRCPQPRAPACWEAISCLCLKHNMASNATVSRVSRSVTPHQISRNCGRASLSFNADPLSAQPHRNVRAGRMTGNHICRRT